MNDGLRKASSISTAATSTTTASLPPTARPSNENNLFDAVTSNNDTLIDIKIGLITEGLTPFFATRLKNLPQENALTIVDYIISMKNEINLSDSYRKLNIYTLFRICKFLDNKKTYKEFTRDDILQYL